MLTLLMINANSLHDDHKWQDFWFEIPRLDIICIQQTHLDCTQELSFGLHAQAYDLFYSHGTTNSAGVLIAVKWSVGVIVAKVMEIPG